MRGFSNGIQYAGHGLDKGALENHTFLDFGACVLSRHMPFQNDFGSYRHPAEQCMVASGYKLELDAKRLIECVCIKTGKKAAEGKHNLPVDKRLPCGWQIVHISKSESEVRLSGSRAKRLQLALDYQIALAFKGELPPPCSTKGDHQVCFVDPVSRVGISTWPMTDTLAARIAREERRWSGAAVRQQLGMPGLVSATEPHRLVLAIRRREMIPGEFNHRRKKRWRASPGTSKCQCMRYS